MSSYQITQSNLRVCLLIQNPQKGERQFVGERRSVTVLFADAKGFTPMSEKLNEEQVYNIMQGFIDIMVDIIRENGGTVTQFLGDGLMALFGAPIAHENSSVKAVSASLKMQATLEKHAIEVNNVYGADCHFKNWFEYWACSSRKDK